MPDDDNNKPLHSTRAEDVAEHIAGQVRDAALEARAGLRSDAADAADHVTEEAQKAAEGLRGEAVEVARGLQATMAALAKQMIALANEMKRIALEGKRSKVIVRALVISVCLDVALSFGLGYVFLKSTSNARRTHDACVTINGVRAKEVELWDHVIELSRATPLPAGQTAEERDRTLTDFHVFIVDTFQQSPCGSPDGGVPDLRWLLVPAGALAGGVVVLKVRDDQRRKTNRENNVPGTGEPSDLIG